MTEVNQVVCQYADAYDDLGTVENNRLLNEEWMRCLWSKNGSHGYKDERI